MIGYKSWFAGGKAFIKDTDGSGVSSGTLADILAYMVASTDTWNVTWQIDAFVAPVLRLMDAAQQRALWDTGKVYIGAYTVTYNQGKSICVRHGNDKVSYYWLEQFYLDEPEPELSELVNKGKVLLAELAKLGINPTRLSSCVAVFDHVFDRLDLPTYDDLPDKVNQWCYSQKGRTWTETFKLGHFQNVTDIDINSCFPSVMAGMYDTRYGTWVEDTKEPAGALVGVMTGQLDIHSYINPFLYANKLGGILSLDGQQPAVISKDGLAYLKESGSGTFKADGGYWWIPKKTYQPLQYTINRMYEERRRHIKPVARAFKGGMVGIYGRFLQSFKDGTLGEHVNPLWGFLIEDGARLKVARYIKAHYLEPRLLAIATDGIMVQGDYSIPASTRMGEWRVSATGGALLVSSGTVYFGDKHPASIYYGEALDMINAAPEAAEWHKKTKRMMTLGDALMGFSDDLGTYQDVEPGFALSFDHDRYFKELPRTGRELLSRVYESQPLNIKDIEG